MAATPETRPVASADRTRLGLLAIEVSPVIAFVITSATGYADPLFSNPPGLLGFPLGIVLLFVAAALTALAVVAAAGARRSGGGAAATVAFAVPALVLVLLGPAFIEWLVRLG